MTEYNIRLNPNCASVVHTGLKFKAGDKGITFKIAVDELDTTGTTAKIVFLRANGTSVESDITGTDGVYTYKTLGNEFAVPGKTIADVKFYASEERVSTASFVFEVSGDTMDGLGAGTGGYSDRLEQLVSEAEEAGELTEQAKAELEVAENDMKVTEAEMAAVLQNFKEQYGEVGALNPRGDWNSDVRYQIRDLVYHNSSSWICLAPNTGVAPTDANIAYWMRSTDLESIINGTTAVGNAKKLNGKNDDDFVYNGGRISAIGFDSENELWVTIDGTKYSIPFGMLRDAIDAKTVGGYHASELLKTLGINGAVGGGNAEGDTPNWQDAPDKKQTWYYYEGIDTEAYNLPTPYCTVVVNKLNYARASALAISWTTGEIWSNALWSTWQGWKKGAFADEVLHLNGSVPMSGAVSIVKNDGSRAFFDNLDAHAVSLGIVNVSSDITNLRELILRDSVNGASGGDITKALMIREHIDGVASWYTVLHTGNSNAVIKDTTAPSDTSAVWVDTANKAIKIYEDGAWTALA